MTAAPKPVRYQKGCHGKLRKSIQAKALVSKGPSQFKAEGKNILCSHCGADCFVKGEAQLNTAGMTFFDLDWANKSASTLACTKCGKIEWFLKKPEEIS